MNGSESGIRGLTTEEVSRWSDFRKDYNADGWVKIPGLLNAEEIATIRAIIEEARNREDFKPQAAGARADQALPEYRQILDIYRALWKGYPEIEQLIRRIAPYVGFLQGWERTRLWQDRLFIKRGREFGSRPTAWHQDVNLPIDRRGWCTVWIAIVDVPKSKGPMTFVNGSHRLGSLGIVNQMEDKRDLSEILEPQDWSVVRGCESGAPLAAGDATIHNMLTLHRAGENTDIDDRIALALSFMDARQKFTGSPNPVTDGLGLKFGEPFDHENFPIVA